LVFPPARTSLAYAASRLYAGARRLSGHWGALRH
jgi:hypothetical protein